MQHLLVVGSALLKSPNSSAHGRVVDSKIVSNLFHGIVPALVRIEYRLVSVLITGGIVIQRSRLPKIKIEDKDIR